MGLKVLAIDVSTNKIGWCIGECTSDINSFKLIQGGSFVLSNREIEFKKTYTQTQESRFYKLLKELKPITQLINDHNVELITFELSTHGYTSTMQKLNQFTGLFKAYFWMCIIKNVFHKPIQFKTFNASQWQSLCWGDAIKKLIHLDEPSKHKESKRLSLERASNLGYNCKDDDDLADAINMASCSLVLNDIGYDTVKKKEANIEKRNKRTLLKKYKYIVQSNRELIVTSINKCLDYKFTKKMFDDKYKKRSLYKIEKLDLNAELIKPFKKYNEAVSNIKKIEDGE